MKLLMPKYNHCLTNVSASILKYYNLPSQKASLKELDEKLVKDYRHLFVIVIDGMGDTLLSRLNESSFLRSHKIATISSVFPPTTVAATSALISGMEPIETGRFGWTQYFHELDNNVVVFTNTTDKGELLNIDVQKDLLPIPSIFNQVSQERGILHQEIFPSFRKDGYTSFKHLKEKIVQCNKIEEKAIFYVYINEYDYYMHEYGPKDSRTLTILKDIETTLSSAFESLTPDSAFIITADHGHIDVEEIFLLNYKDFMDTLERAPSFEVRALNFFVKENRKEEFVKLFNKYFRNDYILFSKQECLENNLFGITKCNKHTRFIGDFMACAISNKAFNPTGKQGFKGNHAGLSEEEMQIPLIFIDK